MAEWKKVKLEDVADVFDGTHQTPDYVNEGVPFVSVENIEDIWSTDKFITKEAFDAYPEKPQKNDILMTRITAGIIGRTAIVDRDNPLAYYVSLALIRCKKDVMFPNYLSQYIEGPYFKKELNKRIIHTAFPKKINLGDIGKCLVEFPPIEEQKKIAATLSVWDSAIEKMEKFIDAKENELDIVLRQNLLEKGIALKWKEIPLTEILKSVTPPSKIHQDSYLNSGKYPIVDQSKDLIAGWTNDESSVLKINRPLIIFGDHTCALKIMHMPFAQGADGIKILSAKDGYDPTYIYYAIKANPVIPEGYKRHFSALMLKNVFCPSFEEQKKYAAYFKSFDDELSLLKQKLENYKKQKQGLMQKLLTGQWRVK